MSLRKTEAIVLKSQKLGETSKIVTLYTRKYGKMKVVAKGARGLKSRFFGTLNTLNHIALVYYFKEKRELQFLSQADIINSVSDIRNNLEKTSLALIMSEIVLRSQFAEESNPNLFRLLLEFLDKLDAAEYRIENYLIYFQLEFLQISGFNPKLDECINCKKSNIEKNSVFFSLTQGGYYCSDCKRDGLSISNATLHLLKKLTGQKFENAQEIENSPQTIKESIFVLSKFMAYHIEGLEQIKSAKFYELITA